LSTIIHTLFLQTSRLDVQRYFSLENRILTGAVINADYIEPRTPVV